MPTHHRGQHHHRARYPDALVQRARELYRPGTFGYKRIAAALGVPERTVADWLRGDTREQPRAERAMDAFLRRSP